MEKRIEEPYFFNPNMDTEELEDWLVQQKIFISRYNSLLKQKAALTEQLAEIEKELNGRATYDFKGKTSFPWDPSPLQITRRAGKK
ncbi:hypothetical protein KKJ04_18075 [Xenorhabdus bovienii]|uniref:hypothetical protein n=1 Tax=Xenorhabdus bovienii TaxID=40576 RepID=UPI0023B2832B|nr:hypothetical protein [Xenorhabdus bovienii]MDE9447449.1 hypothetical protein [Xenorhabdus bovienii]